jgi:hypothetical protein
MLRFPLIHPPLLAALAACGHGGKVLLADANYSHSTNVHPGATTIYLNLRPGLLAVHQVLAPLLEAVPVEAADVMTPGDGTDRVRVGAGSGNLAGELGVVEIGVPAACGQQSLMSAALGDLASVHDENMVGLPDGGQPVGDHQGRPAG